MAGSASDLKSFFIKLAAFLKIEGFAPPSGRFSPYPAGMIAVVKTGLRVKHTAENPCQNEHLAETIHCMNRTEESFRIVAVRKSYQNSLFDENDIESSYTVIARNMDGLAEDVLKWYNQRGASDETRIKELKIDLGMKRMPCG